MKKPSSPPYYPNLKKFYLIRLWKYGKDDRENILNEKEQKECIGRFYLEYEKAVRHAGKLFFVHSRKVLYYFEANNTKNTKGAPRSIELNEVSGDTQ